MVTRIDDEFLILSSVDFDLSSVFFEDKASKRSLVLCAANGGSEPKAGIG
jgi:hypothetical protein